MADKTSPLEAECHRLFERINFWMQEYNDLLNSCIEERRDNIDKISNLLLRVDEIEEEAQRLEDENQELKEYNAYLAFRVAQLSLDSKTRG